MLLHIQPAIISAIIDIDMYLHFVSLRAGALFRHRRGRKTETSSDASDEAPERARNDTPKEVKLHEGSILFSRHSGEVSQASIRRFPWPQGRRSRGDRPEGSDMSVASPNGRDKRDPPAREICLPRRFGARPFSRWRK